MRQVFSSPRLENVERVAAMLEEAGQHEIVLQHAPAAAPGDALQAIGSDGFHVRASVFGQMARFTMMSLILPMASEGLRFLGHTSTQFMMV